MTATVHLGQDYFFSVLLPVYVKLWVLCNDYFSHHLCLHVSLLNFFLLFTNCVYFFFFFQPDMSETVIKQA